VAHLMRQRRCRPAASSIRLSALRTLDSSSALPVTEAKVRSGDGRGEVLAKLQKLDYGVRTVTQVRHGGDPTQTVENYGRVCRG